MVNWECEASQRWHARAHATFKSTKESNEQLKRMASTRLGQSADQHDGAAQWRPNLPWKSCGNTPKCKLCKDSCKYHLLKRVCEQRTIREAPDIIVVFPWHAALPSLLLLETFGNPSRNHGIPRQRNFSRRLWDCSRSWTGSPQGTVGLRALPPMPWGKGSLLHHASPAWCSQPATADWRWRGD